jgi:p-aminobenzoyl-glutamate transporter AbgT
VVGVAVQPVSATNDIASAIADAVKTLRNFFIFLFLLILFLL